MNISVDEKSGCCPGVKKAIEEAEIQLSNLGELYSLGAIVHNDTELKRLAAIGLKVINNNDYKNLKDTTVLIRAHGEPPCTYNIAKENNLTLIDCTCPVVLKLQQKIKQTYIDNSSKGGQVLIFGKKGHAEVNGLIGQIGGNAVIIEGKEDIDELLSTNKIDLLKPIYIFSQTTKDPFEFNVICEEVNSRVLIKGGKTKDVHIYNTICGQVSNRHNHLKEFARTHSLIIFVGGKESSNGKILFELCKKKNTRSYFIEDISEIDTSWIKKDDNIGICGATSTPKWQLDKVFSYLCEINLS